MRPCSVCEHLKRLELDAALVEGESVRAVAQRFQVTKSAVERHKNGHLKPRLRAKAAKASETSKISGSRSIAVAKGQVVPTLDDLLSLEGVLGRLVRNLDRLEAAAEDAADNGMHQGLAAVSGQLTRSIEMVCRLKGHFQEASAPSTRSQFGVVIILPEAAPARQAPNIRPEMPQPATAPNLHFDFDMGSNRQLVGPEGGKPEALRPEPLAGRGAQGD